MKHEDKILILTPVKDGEEFLENYVESIYRLTYPHELISLAFLESDSSDNTYLELNRRLHELKSRFRSVSLFKKDFGFHVAPVTPRWAQYIQEERRKVLAKSRNYLLSKALDDEDWVLWLDVDVIEYPPFIIEKLLATGKSIVQPHCVLEYGGRSFELNAWRDRGKYHMDDLRKEGDLVRLDTVGGTMLLVKADIHREGLIFPSFYYGKENPLARKQYFPFVREMLRLLLEEQRMFELCRFVKGMTKRDILRCLHAALKTRCEGEVETEGLGIMAHDMGYQCWGAPSLEIRHAKS